MFSEVINMKGLIINSLMNNIKRYNSYDKEQLEIIRYGLASLYLNITKTLVIFGISYLLGNLKTLLILMGLYTILRLTVYGVHAKRSIDCWISSSIIFLLVPYLCETLYIDIKVKIALGITSIILFAFFAPADTKKRPLINKKRRTIFKTISLINGTTYTMMFFIVRNNTLSNCILFSLLIAVFVILPITYKIFGVSYNNYKYYKKGEW